MFNKISIHTSDSYWGDSNAIRSWHKQRGWSDIGYHFVILNGIIRPKVSISNLNGSIDIGRPLSKTPASVLGFNRNMIAICLIGLDGKYTAEQLMSAIKLCNELRHKYNIDLNKIKGHYEYPKVSKTCPNLDMYTFRLAIDSYDKGELNGLT